MVLQRLYNNSPKNAVTIIGHLRDLLTIVERDEILAAQTEKKSNTEETDSTNR